MRNTTPPLPSLDTLKDQAKRLRASLADEGTTIGHSRALELIAAGTDIDYDGASAVELIEPGESAGTYREVDFKGGQMNVVGMR